MAEEKLYLLKEKLVNLINGEIQAFDDALKSEDSKDAAKGFPYPTNTFTKAKMMCERINNLSKGAISILQELSNKHVFVIDSNKKQIAIDTVLTELSNEAERLKSLLDNKHLASVVEANKLMIDNEVGTARKKIVTEIDVIINTPELPPNRTHNTVIANTVNAPIQQGGAHAMMTQTVSYSRDELDDLRNLVDVLDKHLDELALDAAAKQKAMAQVATIKAQLEDEPDPVIVKQAGRTLRNITEGAIGSLIATAAQPTVWAWAAPIISKLFGGP
jgi:hypothetical protein